MDMEKELTEQEREDMESVECFLYVWGIVIAGMFVAWLLGII